jgi:mannose-6-phosphate isomerase-like protein (cupin superfamily)
MIVKFHPPDVVLKPRADDPEDTGEGVTAGTCLFRSADGRYQFGLWYFEGERNEPPSEGNFDELLVILEGSVEIECDGQLVELQQGDMIVYPDPS